MTRTDICNLALRRVGEQTIMNLDETSKNAEICNLIFEPVYKQCLRTSNWNFATKRQILVQDTVSPAFGWSYRFILPASYIKALRLSDNQEYSIEGGKLLTCCSDAELVYISYIDDMNQLDDLFVKYLYLKLAVEMSYTLTETNTILNGLVQLAEQAERDALFFNSSEDTAEYIDYSAWISAREAGSLVNYDTTTVR